MRLVSNVSDTNLSQYNDIFESILEWPQYKAPNVTFSDDVTFTNGAIDDEFFYTIPELDTREFYDYNGLSTYPAVDPFGTNYFYLDIHQLMSSSLFITAVVHVAYTIASLVRYCINFLYIHNLPVYFKELIRLFLLSLTIF